MGAFYIFCTGSGLSSLPSLAGGGRRERTAPCKITGGTLPAELRKDALRPLRQLNAYYEKRDPEQASMAEMETYGFSWREFVTAIPSPLLVVTTYKSNGKPNACLQSWTCFTGSSQGFYAILSNVNKSGHLYQSIRETKEAAINFPSVDIYDKCSATIANNGFDNDEIALSGLTAVKASIVNAPMIAECFLNLECRYLWDREIVEGSTHDWIGTLRKTRDMGKY